MPKLTIKIMITEDLGYCCEWFFFHRYKQTAQIADRLGVSTRAVRYHKAASKEGCSKCEGKENCMKKILHIKRLPEISPLHGLQKPEGQDNTKGKPHKEYDAKADED